MQTWDKQTSESNQAFAIYSFYRDNIEYRNPELLAEITNKNKSVIKKWISQYNWASRCTDYDKFIQNKNNNSVDNQKFNELKQTIDKLQTMLKDKINEQFEGIETAKIDDLIKLITNLNKLAIDMEKTNTSDTSLINNEYVKKIRANPKAMKAFYEFIRISEID